MSQQTVKAPDGGLRSARRALLILDGAFFLAAAVLIALAPVGFWHNRAGGMRMWDNSDPGGPYVISAAEFFAPGREPPFVGHPGTTLQLPIAAGAWAWYGVQRLGGGGESFIEYWARNVRLLFIVAGLITVLTHVASFHALFAFSRRLLGDARWAFVAVLAYATLFPTLFYATRISVEPLLVTFFLLTMVGVWEAWGPAGRGPRERRRSLAFSALAGAASVGALYTKLHLAAPLPVLALVAILVGGRRGRQEGAGGVTGRLAPAGVFMACATVCFAVGMLKTDWRSFLGTWRAYSPMRVPQQPRQASGAEAATSPAPMTPSVAVNEEMDEAEPGPDPEPAPPPSRARARKRKAPSVWWRMWVNLTMYVPGRTPQGLFTIVEGVFVVFAVIGLVTYWRISPDDDDGWRRRGLLAWALLYCVLISPVLAYRGMWHYFFLHLAVAAPMFAYGMWRLLLRVAAKARATWTPMRYMGVGAVLTVLLHGASIVLVAESKWRDVKMYRQEVRPYYDALGRCVRGEKVAVLAREEPALWKLHGGYPNWTWRAAAFHEAFNRQFVTFTRGQGLSREQALKLGAGVVVDARRWPAKVITIRRFGGVAPEAGVGEVRGGKTTAPAAAAATRAAGGRGRAARRAAARAAAGASTAPTTIPAGGTRPR